MNNFNLRFENRRNSVSELKKSVMHLEILGYLTLLYKNSLPAL